jgi:hypothetical protein
MGSTTLRVHKRDVPRRFARIVQRAVADGSVLCVADSHAAKDVGDAIASVVRELSPEIRCVPGPARFGERVWHYSLGSPQMVWHYPRRQEPDHEPIDPLP